MSSPTSPCRKALEETSKFAPTDTKEYRQSIYHSTVGRRIAEYRRRSHRDRNHPATPSANFDWILYPQTDQRDVSKSLPAVVPSHTPPHDASQEKVGLVKHVTSAKRRSDRSKPRPVVIVDSRVSKPGVENKECPAIQDSANLRPPPAPRLERLGTPDLQDLDERAFCDCTAEPHIVKSCVSCRKEGDPCMAWA